MKRGQGKTLLEGIGPKVTVLDMLIGFALSAGGALGQDTESTVVKIKGTVGVTALVVVKTVVELVHKDSAVVTQVVVLVTTGIP